MQKLVKKTEGILGVKKRIEKIKINSLLQEGVF
jgi:hypothetical protein